MADIASTKPVLSQIAELISAISSVFWPLIVIAVVWLLRHRLGELLQLTKNKLEGAYEIQIGSLILKGPIVTQQGEVLKGSGLVAIAAATKRHWDERGKIYDDSRNLFIVHTIKPSETNETSQARRVFDVCIYLASHHDRGRLNDVKKVTYYLGDKLGTGQFGSVFSIDSSNQNFSLVVELIGSGICLARIEFQDGSIHETYRYLDFEMAPLYGSNMLRRRTTLDADGA